MPRRRSAIFALVLVGACSGAESTAPRSLAAGPAALADRGSGDGGQAGDASGGTGHPLACLVQTSLSGSVLVGAGGGELVVGPHRLIIPPGAVTTPTRISGTVPAGNTLQIHFEPSGLHFNRPAVLVLDAASCGQMPTLLWIDEQGGTLDRIRGVYSRWFHTVTGLIEHFSVYALDV